MNVWLARYVASFFVGRCCHFCSPSSGYAEHFAVLTGYDTRALQEKRIEAFSMSPCVK